MRLFMIATSAVFALGCRGAARTEQASPEAQLAAHRDRERVLVVLAPSESDPSFIAQKKLWADAGDGFAERDLVVLRVFGDAAGLDRKFGLEPGRFVVVLVGKDGHAASKSTEPVPAPDIFAQIDAMPMRQAEMRERTTGR